MTQLARFFPDARLTELGKIKIGGLGEVRKAQSGRDYRMPRKDSFFTVTTTFRNKAGDLVEDVALMSQLLEKYGEPDFDNPKVRRLRQIPIRLLTDDVDDAVQVAYVWYSGKACAARSDGKTVTWNVDRQTGQVLPEPLIEDWKPEYLDLMLGQGDRAVPMFKLHAKLSCIIAANDARWGGVYCFRTTSQITARQILSDLTMCQAETGGILTGIPLWLVVRPMMCTPTIKGKPTPTVVYVCHIEMRGAELKQIQADAREAARWQLENLQQVQAMRKQYKLLCLPAPGQESAKEIGEVVAEFVPEAPEQPAEHSNPAPDPAWEAMLQGQTPQEAIDADIEPPAQAQPQEAPPEKAPKTIKDQMKDLATAYKTKNPTATKESYLGWVALTCEMTEADVGAAPWTAEMIGQLQAAIDAQPTPEEAARIKAQEAGEAPFDRNAE